MIALESFALARNTPKNRIRRQVARIDEVKRARNRLVKNPIPRRGTEGAYQSVTGYLTGICGPPGPQFARVKLFGLLERTLAGSIGAKKKISKKIMTKESTRYFLFSNI